MGLPQLQRSELTLVEQPAEQPARWAEPPEVQSAEPRFARALRTPVLAVAEWPQEPLSALPEVQVAGYPPEELQVATARALVARTQPGPLAEPLVQAEPALVALALPQGRQRTELAVARKLALPLQAVRPDQHQGEAQTRQPLPPEA